MDVVSFDVNHGKNLRLFLFLISFSFCLCMYGLNAVLALLSMIEFLYTRVWLSVCNTKATNSDQGQR